MNVAHPLLAQLDSPLALREMSTAELYRLGGEIRDVLCSLISLRSVHFASNLGVVELCLALHHVFDFRRDRLIWDTGHQIYPHKLLTGRYRDFSRIRTKGGWSGYPNPDESPYDLFMTGHAGCSISTLLGMKTGDELLGRRDRHCVAVIGDGAFQSGIVFEAMNNAGGLEKNLLVILNDNKMSICPRVGGLGSYLDRLRSNSFYTGLKGEVSRILNKVPLFGDPAERFLAQLKEAVKAGLHGGMLFEDLGFRYLGPVDGHDIAVLRKYLKMVKSLEGPVLLHAITEKGHGFSPAVADPVFFHTPPRLTGDNGRGAPSSNGEERTFTHFARDAIAERMSRDQRVTVLTAAMCQGNKLEPIRDRYPDRFFDTGICESHAVAFAAGQAKAGARPIVDIYSTFLQRSFDQIFQEAALQNLPVVFMLDRAGLAGPDGPTHHGLFDLAYLRLLPNMTVLAPGDALDLPAMLQFALQLDSPVAIRYPKARATEVPRRLQPVRRGKAEILLEGNDCVILCCGALLAESFRAARQLRQEGWSVGLINARFAKPIDRSAIFEAIDRGAALLTVEEGSLIGGFGAAVLEAVSDEGLQQARIRRLGVPDRFIPHGARAELLADLGLDAPAIARAARTMIAGRRHRKDASADARS